MEECSMTLSVSFKNDIFEGTWEATSISWDGGKDFVDRLIFGQQTWAECKMYEKNLSIKAISNTLVMAINEENVRDIIIFSYSPLNPNAVYHLSSFSFSTKINIQVFDDFKLEELIINSKKTLVKYFGKREFNVQGIDTPLKVTPFFL
jgi:hypothetical protein